MISDYVTVNNLQQQQYQQQSYGLAGQLGSGQIYYGGMGSPQFTTPLTTATKTKEKSMVKEIRTDMQAFMKEHKSIIYWTLILYVVDHYCFEGALKTRLQKMVQNLVGKVESKLDQHKI